MGLNGVRSSPVGQRPYLLARMLFHAFLGDLPGTVERALRGALSALRLVGATVESFRPDDGLDDATLGVRKRNVSLPLINASGIAKGADGARR